MPVLCTFTHFFTLYLSFIIKKKRTVKSQIADLPIYSQINYGSYFPLGKNAVSHRSGKTLQRNPDAKNSNSNLRFPADKYIKVLPG